MSTYFFSPKSVINRLTTEQYMSWWFEKVKDGSRKLFITDSCKTHLNDDLKRRMPANGVCMAVIPRGYTQYIQLLDVHVSSVFKNHCYDCAEEYPGQSCPTVNGCNLVNYGGKRQTCTIIAYGDRIRCFTIYYDDCKLLPYRAVVYGNRVNTPTVTAVVKDRKTSYTSTMQRLQYVHRFLSHFTVNSRYRRQTADMLFSSKVFIMDFETRLLFYLDLKPNFRTLFSDLRYPLSL